jgi:mono/diheme cytochrome c family protein
MKLLTRVGLGLAAVFVGAGSLLWSTPPAGNAPDVARGEYIVKSMGVCSDCHTPMDEKGQPVMAQWLRGSTLGFKPMVDTPVWADTAPNIAGLRGWEDEAAIKFFMTGIAYNDLPARPPMPQYRMNREDAKAVVAYLRSLSPVKAAQ